MIDTFKYRKVGKKECAKRFIIPDIHGCYKTLRKQVEEVIIPSKSDQIFFLGDYIDRGSGSGKVLDYIMNLIATGYDIYPLRGNHEENLLQCYSQFDNESLQKIITRINKSPDLLDLDGNIKEEYLDFLIRLPYFIEMEDCFLVHAGFDFRKPDPFSDYESMVQLYIDINNYDTRMLDGKKLIHGHIVTEKNIIQIMINNNSQIISLDNGCVYNKKHKIYNHKQLGNLCCLELNSMQLFTVKNIED
ncbi:MAG: serine/threonine protein phosphatase [Bacteroidales bacterium]|nr:serine/threonine protein phosphatase [Bacteroidales bacterium]